MTKTNKSRRTQLHNRTQVQNKHKTVFFPYHENLVHRNVQQFPEVPIVTVSILVVQPNLNTESSVVTLPAI